MQKWHKTECYVTYFYENNHIQANTILYPELKIRGGIEDNS